MCHSVTIMAYVPKGVAYLPNISSEQLKEYLKNEKDSKAALRLLCALHRKEERPITEISRLLFMPVSTVSDHLRRLHEDHDNVHDKHNQSPPNKLTLEEHSELIRAISVAPKESGYPGVIWTTKMIKHYVKIQFGKTFSDFGLRKLLHRSNFVRLKPRPSHVKGNAQEQEEFKKNYPQQLLNICKVDMRSSFWTKQDSS